MINFAEFADEKVKSGAMKRRRIINPGAKRLKKLFLSAIQSEDAVSTEQTPDASERGGAGIYVGASFSAKRNPEHLPPQPIYERFTDKFRVTSKFLSSPASGFSMRVVFATMTVGIVAFLKQTQHFYTEQRLLWALIMIAIGRITSSALSVLQCRLNWDTKDVDHRWRRIVRFPSPDPRYRDCYLYESDHLYSVVGHRAGVLVFIFVFTFFEFYVLIKQPRLIIVTILSVVTQGRSIKPLDGRNIKLTATVLILGYELQVQKVGISVH